ncbi:hypothetical protein [Plantactinospora sp. GCM10030261]|uniref:hypothetical protein n=1 Tax=Plantactinospora sp. GCM10030261 TaxID=3273420 RepID=UPI003613CB93
MRAFHTTPKRILELEAAGTLVREVGRHLVAAGYRIDDRERRSWRNSLPELARRLCALGFGDLSVLTEYRLPRSDRRVDAIVAGTHPNGRDVYLVVELKQWSEATWLDREEDLVSVPWTKEAQLHPGAQVEAYCAYLEDMVRVLLERPDAVHGLVYMHNATAPGICRRWPRPRPRWVTYVPGVGDSNG